MRKETAECLGGIMGVIFSVFLGGAIITVMIMIFSLFAKFIISPFLHWLNL